MPHLSVALVAAGVLLAGPALGQATINGQQETPAGVSLWGPNKEDAPAHDLPACEYRANTDYVSGGPTNRRAAGDGGRWWQVKDGGKCSRVSPVAVSPADSTHVEYTMAAVGSTGAEEMVMWAEPLDAAGNPIPWLDGAARKESRRVLSSRGLEMDLSLGPLELPPGAHSVRTGYHINGADGSRRGVTYYQPQAAFSGKRTEAPTPAPQVLTPAPAVTPVPATPVPATPVPATPRPAVVTVSPTTAAPPGGAGARSTADEDKSGGNSALWALLAIPVGLLLLAALLAGLLAMRKKPKAVPAAAAARSPDSYTETEPTVEAYETIQTTISETHQRGGSSMSVC